MLYKLVNYLIIIIIMFIVKNKAAQHACHVLRKLAPMDGESVDKFVVRLRQQARHFNFCESLDDILRDQLIEKLPDMELKEKLLETRNITLAQVLEKMRAFEAAGQHIAGTSDVNAVGRKEDKTNNQSAKTCFSCGKAGHLSRDPCCPAKGRKCSNCLMYGHFSVCCRNPNHTSPVREKENFVQRKPVVTRGSSEGRQTTKEDYVADGSQEEENPAFAFTVVGENEEGVCKVSTSSHVPMMNCSRSFDSFRVCE